MASKGAIARYRHWYAKLLRLYSKPHYERFGEGMEQTFTDLLQERAEEKRGLFGYALWIFVETSAGITRENSTMITIRQKNTIRIALVTAFLLLLPLVAMQFTDEVAWDLADFAVAGVLLFGTGVTFMLVVTKMGDSAYRAAVGVALGTALLLVWMNLAVGLIGNENNPANTLYGGVLAVGIIGAMIARLRPYGMTRVMFAMALAQMLVPVIAMLIWKPEVTSGDSGVLGVFAVNAVFAGLFVLSAVLFRHASTK